MLSKEEADAMRVDLDTVVIKYTESVVPPDPPVGTPQIISRLVPRPKAIIIAALMPDTSNHTLQIGFNDSGDRYVRSQQAIELAGQTLKNPMGVSPMVTLRGFIEDTLPTQLTFGVAWTAVFVLTAYGSSSPIMLAPVSVLATDRKFDFTFDKSGLAEGWYMVSCSGMPAGWDVLAYPMYIRHTVVATQPQTHMPVVCGSYTHGLHGNRHSYAWVRAKFEPTEVPLPPRDFPAWPDTPLSAKPVFANPSAPTPAEKAAYEAWQTSMTRFAYTMLVPWRQDDIYRPNVLPSGVWTTHNAQNYFASSFAEPHAVWQHLDGKRGRGNLTCVTSIRGTRRPTGSKLIYTHPWAKGKMEDDGTIETQVGFVHEQPPPYTFYNRFQIQRPPAKRTLVGDFSGTPVKTIHESWGVAVDYRTTVTDPDVPPVGGEQPHPDDVIEYMTDTRNDRVRKITYNGQDRLLPAKITDFVVGVVGSHPWDCETVDNLLIVTWRLSNQVVAYDMDNNAAVVWTVAIPSPEGVRVKDGTVYVGSSVHRAIMRFPLNGVRTVIKFIDVLWRDALSIFVNLALSDGTHGNVFGAYVTWSNTQYGWPVVFDKNGTRLAIGADNNGWGVPKGSYCPDTMSYATAVELHNGRMIWGTVQDGLHQISLALPADQVVPAIVYEEHQKYLKDDRKLTHGDLAFGLYGYPVPWGMGYDNWLTAIGHKQP